MIQAWASATSATGMVIGLSTGSSTAAARNGSACDAVLSVQSRSARVSERFVARARQ
jgi:hypothetical protein